eukprot:jgi/Picre1/27846/NNA_000810.t1
MRSKKRLRWAWEKFRGQGQQTKENRKAVEAVKESAVMQQTGAAFTKAGESMRNATRKVMSSQRSRVQLTV